MSRRFFVSATGDQHKRRYLRAQLTRSKVTVSEPSIEILSGSTPHPLGATPMEDGSVNFAVTSQNGTEVFLCLHCDLEKPHLETNRIKVSAKEGDTWHIRVAHIPAGATYGYRVDGPWEPEEGHYYLPEKLLLDPYARHISGISRHCSSMASVGKDGEPLRSDSGCHAPRAVVPQRRDYDWEGDALLRRPMTDTVISELHVKGFSILNPAVPEAIRGTYAGLAHEASTRYLQELGITAVQLLPIHHHLDDGFLLNRGLVNYWGYNTIGFFAPETRYAASDDPITEFRDMVKALHRAGIEVILDVVYNHTGEAGAKGGPTCFLRGFDNLSYYHHSEEAPRKYVDYTGCGNSVDLSHPRTLRMVMDSLRYWVEEMHVDGFRFDLAVELGRTAEGYSRRHAFFQAIHQDPILNQTKLIAEPWDLGMGGYQIGNFPTDWAELNGKFRDTVRRFWHGDASATGEFAARITGSEDLYAHNRRRPTASINFVTSHDGFTLHDLVSYNDKHNLANGEGNRDGDSNNHSHNHGIEGPTDDPEIKELRLRQIRNFLTTLILSQGVPFILFGDERLRTQHGNNNGYCQDNELSWIHWDESPEAAEMRQFCARLIEMKRKHAALQRDAFFTGKISIENNVPDISWYRPDGKIKSSKDWNETKNGAFAMRINLSIDTPSLVFLYNPTTTAVKFTLPSSPNGNRSCLIDTRVGSVNNGSQLDEGLSSLVDSHSMKIWEISPV